MITACKGVCPDVPVFGYGYEPKGRYQRDVDSHGEDLDAPCLVNLPCGPLCLISTQTIYAATTCVCTLRNNSGDVFGQQMIA